MAKILITGGTGMVGKSLCTLLIAKGYDVIVLSRHPTSAKPVTGVSYARWDVEKQEIDEKALLAADHIIHLAGASVIAKRWTDSYKKEIVESRTESSKLLVNTLKSTNHHIKTVVSASAIGYYGKDPAPLPAGFVETDPADKNFLGETCRLWESSIDGASEFSRVVKLRLGIVLSNDGGAFVEFKKPLKFGVAPILGKGNQVLSWVHIEDLCNMFLYAIENQNISGVYNAVAPAPVSNKELNLVLSKQYGGKFTIPIHVPGFFLKIGMGERSQEILKSTTVSDSKIVESGFQFQYPTIESAIKDLIVDR